MAVDEQHAAPPLVTSVGAVPSQAGFYLRYGKRLLDVLIATSMLVLVLPLMSVIAVAVAWDSPGPILFAQRRVGKGGDLFTMYKFRTMYAANHDHIHAAHVQQVIQANLEPEPGCTLKIADDPRVTPLGRFLRRTSLDELPQLFNVWRGDMSMVGPRPDLPYAVAVYKPWYHERFTAMPGLTGYWQVAARNTVSYERMIEMDIEYCRRQSFAWDLLLLAQTPAAMISGRGAS